MRWQVYETSVGKNQGKRFIFYLELESSLGRLNQ